jgi:formylglycine-generating enzyme required for sulfatase activity/serine/threonine protein kinase
MASDAFGLIGTVIDAKYRVDEVVGEGGFGIVYRGMRATFDDAVAIKCLKVPPHFTDDAKRLFFDRFREEGKLLSKLCRAHLSIVQVYDFGVTRAPVGAQVPYLVLEWLEGMDLEDVLAQRAAPFGEAEAMELLRPAVEAIATAHRMSIAHRDLKPGNLQLTRDEHGQRMKVLDFGIAKAMQEGETATQRATHTSSGFSAFSAKYGAPEQFLSKQYGSTGPWTDVHALGLILVHMVTGRPPLDGDDSFELFGAATAATRPTPRVRGASVSDRFEAMCGKAIALMPKDRFADAGELLGAMDAILRASKPAPPKPEVRTAKQAPASQALRAPETRLAVATFVPGQGKEQERAATAPAPTRPEAMGPATELAGALRTFVAEPARAASTEMTSAGATGPVNKGVPRWAMGPTVAGLVVLVAIVAEKVWSGKQKEREEAAALAADSARRAQAEASASAAVAASAEAKRKADEERAARDKVTGEMVKIPAGTFKMGSEDGEKDEKPAHEVVVSAFEMDRTEVTVAAYRACVEAGKCEASDTVYAPDYYKTAADVKLFSGFCNWGKTDRATHPINCVDWKQAAAFCEWAGKRLPTEEEWEYAARGTDGRKYPWGDSAPGPTLLNACGAECRVMWAKKGFTTKVMYEGTDGYEDTAPVGSFASGASPFGLQDMAGNVWEWTSSWYSADYSKNRAGTYRVYRGGGWGNDAPADVRAADRNRNAPSDRDYDLGFRCAR